MDQSQNIKIRPDFGPIFLGLVLAALILGSAIVEMRKTTDTITVTGSAKRPIVSDLIVWRGQVSAQAETMQSAYADLQNHTNRVREFLATNKVPETEMSFKSVNTEQIQEYNQNGYSTGRITGYRLTQSFEVRSMRVDAIDQLVTGSNDLISQGVPFMSFQPEYLYTKLADLRIEMLGEATKDATERARTMAQASGSDIGELRSARMGVFQVTQRYSTDVSDYGYYDTSSKEKDITAVVSVSFSLEHGFPLFNLF
jgi:hypothetical protein